MEPGCPRGKGAESRGPCFIIFISVMPSYRGMLIIAGLGLYGLRDISYGLLEWIRKADVVFLEQYTSVLPGFDAEEFSKKIGKRIVLTTRRDIEEMNGEKILHEAKRGVIVFLTIGNPFFATTHVALALRAAQMGINYLILPSVSVFDGIICSLGLQVYKFGKTATLTFPSKEYGFYPHSTYFATLHNLKRGLHTLLLLDLKIEENVFMTIDKAVDVMLTLERLNKKSVFIEENLMIGVARATAPDEKVYIGKIGDAKDVDLGPPPHSIVIPGILHDMEIEYLSTRFGVDKKVLEEWSNRVKTEYLDIQNT